MNKRLALALTCLAAALCAAGPAAAQATDAQKRAAVEKWQQMTPEQKAEAKAKARAKWDAMTPEQQAAAKKAFAEKHPKAAAGQAEARSPAPAASR